MRQATSVRDMSGRTIRPGDVVVSRVNGTRDVYVIGTVEFRNARQLMLRDPLVSCPDGS